MKYDDNDIIEEEDIYPEYDDDKKRDRKNTELKVTVYIFLAMFLALIVYFAVFVQFKAPHQINNSYNMRQKNLAQSVIRGTIYSANGEVLAREALDHNGKEVRFYPYGNIFAHAAGFSTYGNYGLEKTANIELLTSNAPVNERVAKEMQGIRNTGDNIFTSYDPALQTAAYQALGNYKGAVIAMEAKTGKVLAMVSKPDYDPNTVADEWEEISQNEEESPLLNRAVQGLYPPGSTFKIVTALEYIREHPEDFTDYSYSCTGHITAEDADIECYHGSVHGTVDLKASFAKSCNCSFANIGLAADIAVFSDTADKLLFNRVLPLDREYKRSSFNLSSLSDTEERMQSAIGQGKVLVTPMHMALITQAVANDGMMMKPLEILRQENYLKDVIKEYGPEEYKRVMSADEAHILKEYMKEVVLTGTGRKLNGLSYTVAGKTGSAEYGSEKGKSHAWFTGFCDTDDPDIVVTVIMEGAGSGSDYAVPVAKRIFDAYYGLPSF